MARNKTTYMHNMIDLRKSEEICLRHYIKIFSLIRTLG